MTTSTSATEAISPEARCASGDHSYLLTVGSAGGTFAEPVRACTRCGVAERVVTLRKMVEQVARAHYLLACRTDTLSHYTHPVHAASSALVDALLVELYGAELAPAVREMWTDCNESIAYCASVVKTNHAHELAYAAHSKAADAFNDEPDTLTADVLAAAWVNLATVCGNGPCGHAQTGRLMGRCMECGAQIDPLAAPVAAVIEMRPASAYRDEHYGVKFEGATVHRVTGRGVHNRSFPHQVEVWDNTIRPRDDAHESGRFRAAEHLRRLPGAYASPDGSPTDEPTTIILGAQSVMITSSPDPHRKPYGAPLVVGDVVELRYPASEGHAGTIERVEIKARSLADPIMVTVSA